mmetsp:Transcript_17958/g.46092  ORF Transcript_17958/g.46092 Transcript_17958/m.46092 type:complete len:337 (-) Transcript_17958:227-1237(-)
MSADLNLSVGEALDSCPQHVPPEVDACLQSLGFPPVSSSKRIKVSFHCTYFVEFSGPLPDGVAGSQPKAVVQLLGSQLGDKALFHLGKPICAASIVKATDLCVQAGIRAPAIYATGMVEKWGQLDRLPFVVYEFIATETVEDERCAPNGDFVRVVDGIRSAFEAMPLSDVDTGPLIRFDTVFDQIEYLKVVANAAEATELLTGLDKVAAELRKQGIEPLGPVLIHQDLNDGNVLCSPSAAGPWQLDALIDWEGAAVADPRAAYSGSEPWSTLRRLARMVKLRWLAGLVGRGEAPPRCEAAELQEDYEEIGQELVKGGWIDAVVPLPQMGTPGEDSD